MTRWEDEETVIRLACLIEDREDSEQRSMLRMAARLDQEYNRATTSNKKGPWDMDRPDPIQVRPVSRLYDLVQETRTVDPDEGQHHVVIKAEEDKRARAVGRHPLDTADRKHERELF
jgi:hypothetical protein